MRSLFLTVSVLVLTVSVSPAAPDSSQPVPAPQLLQNAMWQAGKLQDFKLDGFLHVTPAKGKDRYHPVTMRTKDRQMVFEFAKDALQVRVIFLPGGAVVQRRASADADWQILSGNNRLAKILDSDITYEDLGLDFCRWSTVKPVGADSILTLPSWCYESTPPTVSNYSKIRFWVSSQYLAVLRADAYGADGKVTKRVEVNGVMQVGNAYTIKEMMMTTLQPGRDLAASRTYLELRDGKAGASGL